MKLILSVLTVLTLFLNFSCMKSEKKSDPWASPVKSSGVDVKAPMMQVSFSTSAIFKSVKVHTLEFCENINGCGDNSSTGFKDITTGNVHVSVAKGDSGKSDIGYFGPLQNDRFYSIEISEDGSKTCATLWDLNGDTSSIFSQNSSKKIIGNKVCSEERARVQIRNSTEKTKIKTVKITNVNFSENLEKFYCNETSDLCATGFKDVLTGRVDIEVQITDEPEKWYNFGALNLEGGHSYTVKFVEKPRPCAQLYKRTDESKLFSEDNTTYVEEVCVNDNITEVQVTNNSGELLDKVLVHELEFVKNMAFCGSGCSSDFKEVTPGSVYVGAMLKGVAEKFDIGYLGKIEKGRYYSINIVKENGKFCGQLWDLKGDTSSEFNKNSTKEQVGKTVCGLAQLQVRNSTQKTKIKVVKIANVNFRENLDKLDCNEATDECATSFKDVLSGTLDLEVQITDEPEQWHPFGSFDLEGGSSYTIKFVEKTNPCAQLYKRADKSKLFSEDSVTLVDENCLNDNSVDVQVTNNSGALLEKVLVHDFEFSKNLAFCGDGCSTGFKKTTTGNVYVGAKLKEGGGAFDIGYLGPLENSKSYSINIVKDNGKFCGQLWDLKGDTSTYFNDNSVKVQVGRTVCGLARVQVKNSTKKTKIRVVKITNVNFSENLDKLSCNEATDECSTGFKDVLSGSIDLDVQIIDEPEKWYNFGTLFLESGTSYTIKFVETTKPCAQLYKRTNESKLFSDDSPVIIKEICLNSDKAKIQVTNNSGALLDKVFVHELEFNSPNLQMCGTGCSTGFRNVTTGNVHVGARVKDALEKFDIGYLGKIVGGNFYSVNIVKKSGKFCGELWDLKGGTDKEFNKNSGKVKVGKTVCGIAKVQVRNGTLETKISRVRIASVLFESNLADVGCDSKSCITGLKEVLTGAVDLDVEISKELGVWHKFGTLNLEADSTYLINISDEDKPCAELWKKTNSTDLFSDIKNSGTPVETICLSYGGRDPSSDGNLVEESSNKATVHIVNNSGLNSVTNGKKILKVKVGELEFSTNLSMCTDGCSTPPKEIEGSSHNISVEIEEEPGKLHDFGMLGAFLPGKKYAVNIVERIIQVDGEQRDKACAELWERGEMNTIFNEDSSKVMISETCLAGDDEKNMKATVQIVNNSGLVEGGEKFSKVRVGALEFIENLDLCTTGCSTPPKEIDNNTYAVSVELVKELGKFHEFGQLGPFEPNTMYAINFVERTNEENGEKRDKPCAELWKRGERNTTFNSDNEKEMVSETCLSESGGEISVQVVNNSGLSGGDDTGDKFLKVKVGTVEFSDNLADCTNGCSTMHKTVEGNSHNISVVLLEKPDEPHDFGLLSGFEEGKIYAVSIVLNLDEVEGEQRDQPCAELWERGNPDKTFNEDSYRKKISETCLEKEGDEDAPKSATVEVVNNTGLNKPEDEGELIKIVTVGENKLSFTTHLAECKTGCSAPPQNIDGGPYHIRVESLSEPGERPDLGQLGPFNPGIYYSVEIIEESKTVDGEKIDYPCAVLWTRGERDKFFNEDSKKEEKARTCLQDNDEGKMSSTQVINNTGLNGDGVEFLKVKVGETAFSDNFATCKVDCATSFQEIGVNSYSILVETVSEPGKFHEFGDLGSFEEGKSYAVNIVENKVDVNGQEQTTPCAELWERSDINKAFKDDVGKKKTSETCLGSQEGVGNANVEVTNNTGLNKPQDEGKKITKVQIGDKIFSENLAFCTTGCSAPPQQIEYNSYNIYVEIEEDPGTMHDFGLLGSFEAGKFYIVIITEEIDNPPCAELWERGDRTANVNDDTSKKFLTKTCAIGGGSDKQSSAQVVNNTGLNGGGEVLSKVKIGTTEFTENISTCKNGCSTPFQDIGWDSYNIYVEIPSEPGKTFDFGMVGSFENGKNYAVNIVERSYDDNGTTKTKPCAELWLRTDTNSFFNDDTSKSKVDETCFESSDDSGTADIVTTNLGVKNSTAGEFSYIKIEDQLYEDGIAPGSESAAVEVTMNKAFRVKYKLADEVDDHDIGELKWLDNGGTHQIEIYIEDGGEKRCARISMKDDYGNYTMKVGGVSEVCELNVVK